MKTLLVLIISFLLFSCTTREENSIKRFVVLSMENNVFVSAKSDFKDTLFYEHKYPDSNKYYYVLLSEKQNKELKILVENVCTEKDSPKYELSIGQELFIVENGQLRFYVNNFSNKSENYEKINLFLKEINSKMIRTKEIKNFWNIGKVIPPPNPPRKIEKIKFKK
jgi:hypothetical protein